MTDAGAFLSRLVTALDQAGIPHMLAGSFASSVHGAPRATRDLDLLIDPTPQSLDRLLDLLAGEDFYLDENLARAELRHLGQFNVIDRPSGWKADLIYRKARAFSRAEFERRIGVALLGVPVFVATAEDTILAKLEWAKLGQSDQQIRDVRGLSAYLAAAATPLRSNRAMASSVVITRAKIGNTRSMKKSTVACSREVHTSLSKIRLKSLSRAE